MLARIISKKPLKSKILGALLLGCLFLLLFISTQIVAGLNAPTTGSENARKDTIHFQKELDLMASQFANDDIRHFSKNFDIPPVESFHIVNVEWYDIKEEEEAIDKLVPFANCSHRKKEKLIHDIPCDVYMNVLSDSSLVRENYTAVIIIDTMDNEPTTRTRVVQFANLPVIKESNKKYFILNRYFHFHFLFYSF